MSDKPEYVYIFDENRRVYGDNRSAPIWIKHWVKWDIVSETSRSWITSHGEKVPKKNAPEFRYCFSEQELTERAYVHDNAYPIAELLRRNANYEQLKKVADIIGYKEEQQK